jgi:hypothetical protein
MPTKRGSWDIHSLSTRHLITSRSCWISRLALIEGCDLDQVLVNKLSTDSSRNRYPTALYQCMYLTPSSRRRSASTSMVPQSYVSSTMLSCMQIYSQRQGSSWPTLAALVTSSEVGSSSMKPDLVYRRMARDWLRIDVSLFTICNKILA